MQTSTPSSWGKRLLAMVVVLALLLTYLPVRSAPHVHAETVAGNVTEPGSSAVVFVDEGGDLFAAIDSLPDAGGTVVVRGNITHTSGVHTWTPKSGRIVVTGLYNGYDYKPTVTFGGSGRNFIDCVSSIEFNYLTFNHKAGASTDFYGGPDLTIGYGMTFLNKGNPITHSNDGYICFRGGLYKVADSTCRMEFYSGTISYIQGGSRWQNTKDTEIIIHPGVTVTDHVQLGGTLHNVDNVNCVIDGANVAGIYITYGSNIDGNINLTLKNGTFPNLLGNRNTDGTQTVAGNLSLTLDAAYITSWGNLLNRVTVSGEKNLTVKNATDLKITDSLAGWNSLTMENSTVWVDTAYAGPKEVPQDAKSVLILDDSTLEENLPNEYEPESKAVVYVGTAEGEVADIPTAYSTLNANAVKGGIIVLNANTTMTHGSATEWSRFSNTTGPVTITSNGKYILDLKSSSGSAACFVMRDVTKFSNIKINKTTDGSATEFYVANEMTFGEGVVCTYNGSAMTTAHDFKLTVRLGEYNASATLYPHRSGKLFMHSGTLNQIQCGNGNTDVVNAEGDCAYAYVGKGATVTFFIQASGTRKATDNVEIVIDNATVNALFLGGYTDGKGKSTTGNVTATIINTNIPHLYGEREYPSKVAVGTGAIDTTIKNLDLTLENSYITNLDMSYFSVSGDCSLTLKNYACLNFTDADLAWWKSVTLDNAVVKMDGIAYAGPSSVINFNDQVNANGDILVSICHNNPLPTVAGATVIPYNTHTLAETPAAAADCTNPGNKAYWTCSVCGRFFADAEAKTEYSENEWVIPAGHTMEKTDAKAADCQNAGHEAYWFCSACESYFADEAGTSVIENIDSWKAEGGDGYVAKLPHAYDPETGICGNGCGLKVCDNEGHSYTYDCSENCSVCGVTNPSPAVHTFANECDTDCNICGATREVEGHTSNAQFPCQDGRCTKCDTLIPGGDHTYIDGYCQCGDKQILGQGQCGENLNWILYGTGEMIISGTGAMYEPYEYSEGTAPWIAHKDAIKTVTIENGVTTISSKAFFQCGNITTVSLPSSLEAIGSAAFAQCSKLESIDIPDSVSTIGRSAFQGNANLVSVKLPSGLTEIDEWMFEGCKKLAEITIPSTVQTIGMEAFNGCASLTSIVVPDGVTKLNAHVFNQCTNLTYIVIPASVTYIDQFALGNTKDAWSQNNDKLWHILFKGTEAQWENITKVLLGNGVLDKATVHFDCTGDEVVDVANKVCKLCCTHTWGGDNTCDDCGTTCNHAYDNGCDANCNLCGAIREVQGHISDAQFPCQDGKCKNCGIDMSATELHAYDNNCDASCNKCSAIREVGNHVYNNECDTDCNECGYIRQVGAHTSDAAFPCLDGNCIECGTPIPGVAHSYTANITVKPDCENEGTKTFTCDCGKSYTEKIDALGHKTVEVPYKPSSNLVAGNKAHYKCETCGNLFWDAEGQQPTNEDEVALPVVSSLVISSNIIVAKPGDKITITVAIINNPGHISGEIQMSATNGLSIVYDYSDPSNPVPGFVPHISGTVGYEETGIINWANSTMYTGDIELFDVVFIVAENATAGDYTITAAPHRDNSFRVDDHSIITVIEDSITVHVHADSETDNDHICDAPNCDESLSDCVDASPIDHNCDICGEPVSFCKDSLIKTDAKDATCIESGHAAYWTCSVCGKHYNSEIADSEIADLAAWLAEGGDGHIATTGHSWDEGVYTAPTVHKDGFTTYTCGICHETKVETDTGSQLTAVAKVGEQLFATLEEAYYAAFSGVGNTITLLENVTWNGPSGYHVPSSGLTLDLNGKTLSLTNKQSMQFVGKNLVIKNGTFDGLGASYGLFIGNGSVTTNNVTIQNVTVKGGIHISAASNVTLENCTVYADVAKPENDFYAIYAFNAEVSVLSGNYNAAAGKKVICTEFNSELAVSGGTFSAPVAEEHCADGYIPKDNGNGTYGVKVGEYVVRNTTTGIGYESLEEAIAAVKGGETIKLLTDITVEHSTVVLPANVTLDGDNHKLIVNGEVTSSGIEFGIKLTGNATIQNLTIEGGSRGIYADINESFDVTLDNVTILKSARAISTNGMKVDDYGTGTLTVKNSKLAGWISWCGRNFANAQFDNVEFVMENGPRGNGLDIYTTTELKDCTFADGFELCVEDLLDNAVVTKAGTTDVAAPADYKWVGNVLTAKVYVAENTTTGEKYETLDEAIAEVQTNETIKLLSDITLTERLTVSGNLSIDLNGHTISGSFDDSFGMIYVKKGGSLTIDGEGKITSSATYAIGNYGTVTLKNGTLESTGTYEYEGETYTCAALYNFYYAADYYGTANIEGGKVAGELWNSGITSVSGGEIEYLDNSGALTVTGGTITEIYAQGGADAEGVPGAGTLTITDVTAVSVPEDYKLVLVDEGIYKVVAKVYVAENTTTGEKYETLAEAIAEAQDGETIKLLENITVDAEMATIGNVTIDLGGKTLNVTKQITVNAGHTLKITGEGKLIVNAQVAVSGTLDVYDLGYGTSGLVPGQSGNLAIADGGNVKLMSVWNNQTAGLLNTYRNTFFAGSVDGAKVALGTKNYTLTNGIWMIEGAVAAIDRVNGGNSYTETYASLADAIANAKPGETIKLLAGFEDLVNPVVIPADVTLDLNGQTIKANILGKLSVNNGTWITPDKDYVMVGPNADYYKTSDAVMTLTASGSITVHSGTITLVQSWWTLEGQILTIGADATFVIPEDINLNVLSSVIVEGNATVNGSVTLYIPSATVKAPAGLNVITSAGDTVLYVNGEYIVHDHSYDDGVITVKPDCTTEGEKTFTCTCSDCNDSYTEPVAALGHDLTKTDAKAPTCTEDGNIEYWTCSVCDKHFADEEATTELDAEDLVVDAPGHNLTKTDAKAPTCTEDGNIEYWTCDTCGKYFADEEANTELDEDELVIEAGHIIVAVDATASTSAATGNKAHYKCERCGELYWDAEGTQATTLKDVTLNRLGDADGNGIVDTYDANLIQRYSVGMITENDLDLTVCDLDGDGYVDAYDASLIQRYTVGMIASFPIEDKHN